MLTKPFIYLRKHSKLVCSQELCGDTVLFCFCYEAESLVCVLHYCVLMLKCDNNDISCAVCSQSYFTLSRLKFLMYNSTTQI